VSDAPLIGAHHTRLEDDRLLRGAAQYLSDLHVPEMLTAAVVRSSHAHATILEVDASAARAVPGVVAVFTGRELGAIQRPLPSLGHMPPSLERVLTPLVRSAPMYPLASGRARYAGEPLAVVVGVDRYAAEDGAEVVRVRYEPRPAAIDAEAACAGGATLYDGWPDNTAFAFDVRLGEVEPAFRGAAVVFRDRNPSQR
jgi:carbon-monoxide dehydrogenase large subunit